MVVDGLSCIRLGCMTFLLIWARLGYISTKNGLEQVRTCLNDKWWQETY